MKQNAKEAGFKACPALIWISRVGAGSKKKSKILYRALQRKIDRTMVRFKPYGVDKITRDAISLYISRAKVAFPGSSLRP
jgi:hypothetical protein